MALKKALVTGGLGFIGSHLASKLMDEGCEVTVVDDRSHSIVEPEGLKGIRFYGLDVSSDQLRVLANHDFDVIFHLAALVDVPKGEEEPERYCTVNVAGTTCILSLAHQIGTKVVYTSSSSVYGNPAQIPIREDTPLGPLNIYGETKLQAEEWCLYYGKEKDVRYTILRYFNVYGDGEGKGVIDTFLRRPKKGEPLIIYGDGQQTRDFVHVDDVVEATIKAVGVEGTFNVGSGIETKIIDVAQRISRIHHVPIKHEEGRRGDVFRSCADVTLARETLNWRAKHKIAP